MEIFCSICCCNLLEPKQETLFPLSSHPVSISRTIYSSFCGHIYHKPCILEWLSRSKNCPECRCAIRSKEDFHKIYFNVNKNTDDDTQTEMLQEKMMMQKRTEKLTKCIKHLTKELGHVELKFDKLKQEIARKDQEISELRNLLNQERCFMPLRRQTLK